MDNNPSHSPRSQVDLFGDQPFCPMASPVWPITDRTRFVIYIQVAALTGYLIDEVYFDNRSSRESGELTDADAAVAAILADLEYVALNDFPAITLTQPRSWWEKMVQSAVRLEEALRTGIAWNPHNLAEDFILLAATTAESVHESLAEIEPNPNSELHLLPATERDYQVWEALDGLGVQPGNSDLLYSHLEDSDIDPLPLPHPDTWFDMREEYQQSQQSALWWCWPEPPPPFDPLLQGEPRKATLPSDPT
jgi:hypothetical protein